MNLQQQSNPTHFHQITLDRKYDKCYIFDDLEFAILIGFTDDKTDHNNVVVTQVNEYGIDISSIKHRFHHQWIDIQLFS